jgi:hypothetical protein
MVSATSLGQRRPAGAVAGAGSRSGSAAPIWLRSAGADADPVELFEEDVRSGLALIRLLVCAAIAVAMLGVGAQIFG